MRRISLAVVILAGWASASGQVTMKAGPSPAPIGSSIAISVSNDTASGFWFQSPCPWQILDSAGGVVFAPGCVAASMIGPVPGQVAMFWWDQLDDNGVQVPPGTYIAEVFLPQGPALSAFVIGPVAAGLEMLGSSRVGRVRNFYLSSPQHSGLSYLVGASGPPVSGGIPTCGGMVPLEPDAVLALSLGANAYFANFSGSLDATGASLLPMVSIPNDPSLNGLVFHLAFVALDPTAPCVVQSVSAGLVVVLN